jgi:hypothetical protein
MVRAAGGPRTPNGRFVFDGREWVDASSLIPTVPRRPWTRHVVSAVIALVSIIVFCYAVTASGGAQTVGQVDWSWLCPPGTGQAAWCLGG